MKIKRSKTFLKHYQKLPLSFQKKVDKKLKLFFQNPFDPSLRNHTLKGKYLGCRSVDITGDCRVIFRELSGGQYEFIIFIDVGTHSQLY